VEGRGDIGLGILDDVLRTSRVRGENWFEAELLRLRGELLRDQDPAGAAMMLEARPSGKKQRPGSSAPRPASHAYGAIRESAPQRALLGPVYGRFTEGFDTTDLKDAKGLLEELSG